MNYEFKKSGNALVVNIRGYIDATTIESFKKMFDEIYKILPEKVFLNFEMVEYVSSSGWGTLMSNSKKMKEKGIDFFVGRMSASVKKIFDLMDLGRFIKYAEQVPEGVEEVRVEEKTIEVEGKLKAIIKNLIVENPFMNEGEIKEIIEKKLGKELDNLSFKKILIEMGLDTREKRLAFAYKTLKKIIERKR